MLRSLFTTAVTVGWLIILALVGGRFLALLADANTNSEIVERIYRHSDFWVKPFFNMFDLTDRTLDSTGGVFEPASLLAFAVYFVAGAVILSVLSVPISGWFPHRHRTPLSGGG